MSAQITKDIIDAHEELVEFGSPQDAVDDTWLEKAQAALGVQFSQSYRWFLENYGGGEIGGDEVYSIYGMPFDDVNGGDIVFQHLMNLKNGQTNPKHIAITETDFGETYYFDYSKFDGVEAPILVKLGEGEPQPFADDFYEFIQKRVEQFTS